MARDAAQRSRSEPEPGPLSNADRQRRFRENRRRELEALRHGKQASTIEPLRHDTMVNPGALSPSMWTEEAIDDALTALRQAVERLDVQYQALLRHPGLTGREVETIRYRRFTEARKDFERAIRNTPRRSQALTLVQPKRRQPLIERIPGGTR